MSAEVVIPGWAQGRPGLGQGGYSSARFALALPEPVDVNLRAAIPLDSPMAVVPTDSGWDLRRGEATIMQAVRRSTAGPLPRTEPVAVPDAAEAMSRFAGHDQHEAPVCFSCGLGEQSMRVWPGRLADGTPRVATRWVPPASVAGDDGVVDEAIVWTVLDCVQGFYVNYVPERHNSLTVRFAAEVVTPVRAGAEYAIVGFGDGSGWDGRKRGASANIFDADGNLVAAATSLWVEPREG